MGEFPSVSRKSPKLKKKEIMCGPAKCVSQFDKPLQQQPPQKAAYGIVNKVPPGKGCPNQGTSNKRGADGLENKGIPQLQYLKNAGDNEYPNGNFMDKIFTWKN